jgi:glycosyltransferase involved in cell wall biosynthesis
MTIRAVHVRGPFRGTSGYDHHVREFVRELLCQGIAVQLENLPNWSGSRRPSTSDDALFASLGRRVDAKVSLQFCMPEHVVFAAGKRIVNYTMFEATRIPAPWVQRAHEVDLTVLPTESSRIAWVDSGAAAERLRLCPLGVDVTRFRPDARPLRLQGLRGEPLSDYRLRFLNVSEPSPRKNLAGLIRAWLTATTPEDNAILVMKVASHGGTPGAFARWLHEAQEVTGKALSQAAPICALRATLSDEQMTRLFASVTHYISMSHAEGWDQPMMEAAATDLRLIAPEHSAYLAYLNESIADLLPSHEVPTDFEDVEWGWRLFGGASWWKPDDTAAAAAIRAAIDGTGQAKASPRTRIAEGFTWAQATKTLIEILTEVENNPQASVYQVSNLTTENVPH